MTPTDRKTALLLTGILICLVLGTGPGRARALDDAGTGELLIRLDDGYARLPVLDTEVELSAAGMLMRGEVTQRFINATDAVIEAVYVFPLPEDASVDAMEIRVGDRTIRSVVREKQEARRTYEQARSEGRKAALVAQHRPNLFSTEVANIGAGETVEVRLAYLARAAYDAGRFSLRFPLTFVPRFGWADQPQAVESPRSGPATPRARIRLRLDPGMPIEEPRSDSHALEVRLDGPVWEIAPVGGDIPADRDFVVSWRPLVSELPGAALFVEERDGQPFGMLLVTPPRTSGNDWGLPTETIFVIDVSGSMSGESIRRAKRALVAALDRMRPGDTFNILSFASSTASFRGAPVDVDETALDDARRWTRALDAGGGTRILPALELALDQLQGRDGDRNRRIVFLTDGGVGNERLVFRTIAERLGDSRIHTLGIGSAPNGYFMRRAASFGRGLCAFASSGDADAANGVAEFFERIDRPAVGDLDLAFEGLEVDALHPERLPDLYPGQTIAVAFRVRSISPGASVRLTGRARSGPVELVLPLRRDRGTAAGIPTLWARARIDTLMGSLIDGADRDRVREQVIGLGVGFGLVTAYTSRVAVEEFASATGDSVVWRPVNAVPAGTELAQGGTHGPLLLLVGSLLLFVALALYAVARPVAS